MVIHPRYKITNLCHSNLHFASSLQVDQTFSCIPTHGDNFFPVPLFHFINSINADFQQNVLDFLSTYQKQIFDFEIVQGQYKVVKCIFLKCYSMLLPHCCEIGKPEIILSLCVGKKQNIQNQFFNYYITNSLNTILIDNFY